MPWRKMDWWYEQKKQKNKLTAGKEPSLDPKVHPNVVEFVDHTKFSTTPQGGKSLEDKLKEAQGGATAKAAVVPVEWLLEQLVNCMKNKQETIRIAAGKNGDVYIEMWMNPPGWGNDWPEIDLP